MLAEAVAEGALAEAAAEARAGVEATTAEANRSAVAARADAAARLGVRPYTEGAQERGNREGRRYAQGRGGGCARAFLFLASRDMTDVRRPATPALPQRNSGPLGARPPLAKRLSLHRRRRALAPKEIEVWAPGSDRARRRAGGIHFVFATRLLAEHVEVLFFVAFASRTRCRAMCLQNSFSADKFFLCARKNSFSLARRSSHSWLHSHASIMLTVPPRKTSRRVTAVAAATVLLLLGVVSYTAAPAVLSEPAGVLEKLGFRKKANAEEESDECREPRAPMRALVNGAVDAVVKRVPGSNIAGKVQGGLEAKVSTARVRVSVRAAGSHGWRRDAQVTVMGVETVVNNISIQALSVGDVGITSCRTKGKRFQVHLSI